MTRRLVVETLFFLLCFALLVYWYKDDPYCEQIWRTRNIWVCLRLDLIIFTWVITASALSETITLRARVEQAKIINVQMVGLLTLLGIVILPHTLWNNNFMNVSCLFHDVGSMAFVVIGIPIALAAGIRELFFIIPTRNT